MKFFNSVNKANAELSSAEEAMKPDLEKAGITSAQREGKTIPIAEATLAEKYAALRASQPSGTDLEGRASLLESNHVIATRCDKAETDLAIAQTNVATLTRENATLKTSNETHEASVATLTAEKSNQINLRDAAVKENSRLEKECSVWNTELSKLCIAANCLDLKLDEKASAEQKLAAAQAVPWSEKLTAYRGAVNAAIAKTGVSFDTMPQARSPQNKKPDFSNLSGLERAAAAHAVNIK